MNLITSPGRFVYSFVVFASLAASFAILSHALDAARFGPDLNTFASTWYTFLSASATVALLVSTASSLSNRLIFARLASISAVATALLAAFSLVRALFKGSHFSTLALGTSSWDKINIPHTVLLGYGAAISLVAAFLSVLKIRQIRSSR